MFAAVFRYGSTIVKLGKFDLQAVSDGPIKLDGGALFGIVPKPLWSRLVPPDELNRVALCTTCMLVRTPAGNVLVEAGMGRKHNEKMRSIYGLGDELELVKSLARLSLKPEDISAVFCTHLHLDHAGGGTTARNGEAVPTFPNAAYYVQRGEWEQATHPNAITRGSYLQENFVPVQKAGQLRLLDGDCEPVPGVRVRVTGGHTDYHQAIIAESQGQCVAFLGDIMPLTSNLRPAYNTAFDHHPLETMRVKARMFDDAIRNGWLVWLYHDPQATAVRLKQGKDCPEVASVEIPASRSE